MSKLESAQKEISDLREEVTALKDALDKVFRALGHHEWVQFRPKAKVVDAAEVAAIINEAAPEPASVVLKATEIRDMVKALNLPSVEQALQTVNAAQSQGKV